MNRALVAIVTIEALVILFLLLDRSPDLPPLPTRPPGTPTESGVPSPVPPIDATTAPDPDAAEPEPGGVFLFGRIAGPNGVAPEGRTWVYIRPERGKQITIMPDEDGWYGRGGLTPGHYEVQVQAPGHEEVTEPIEIPAGRPTHRHDFALERSVKAAVFFLTPDGRPLRAEYWVERGLSVVVTRERPERLPPTFLSGYSNFGTSQYRPADWDDDEPEDGRHGTLTVRGGLPVFVSAVLRAEILETVEVAEPVDRLEFRVGSDRITTLLSAVTFRLTADADSLSMKRFSIGLSDRQSTASGEFESDGQQVTIRNRPPGGQRLEIRDWKGMLEPYNRNIVLPAGKTLDLGTIHLKGAIDVRGRVLDPEGNPVPGVRIDFYDLDRPWEDQTGTAFWPTSGPDGSFAFTAGPRRLCVRATPKQRPPGVAQMDLRAGAAKPVVIRLAPGPRVRVDPGDARPPHVIRIEDSSGRVMAGRRQNSAWPLITHLAPGNYDRVVIDAKGVEHRTPFVVGGEPVTVR